MNLGTYLHIPFCKSRCTYCHFVTGPWVEALVARYAAALTQEITSASARFRGRSVDSVYFGGGTPSMVEPAVLEVILNRLRDSFDVSLECEITLEANPETIDQGKAETFLRTGFNRISIGVQSFVDAELQAIGRRHSASQAKDAIADARRVGFRNINLDLILGLPGQTRDCWRRSLLQALAEAPEHVSVYMLDTDDPAAPIHHQVLAGTCGLPDEDVVADCYAETLECLGNSGLIQYEISNFARPGFECRHNLKYWQCEPVIGFGLSSHSFDGLARYSNVSDLEAYLNLVEGGRSPVVSRTQGNAYRMLEEVLFLGLRLNRGVNLPEVRARYGDRLVSRFEPALAEMLSCGLLEREAGTVRLTARGRLMSNDVFSALLQ